MLILYLGQLVENFSPDHDFDNTIWIRSQVEELFSLLFSAAENTFMVIQLRLIWHYHGEESSWQRRYCYWRDSIMMFAYLVLFFFAFPPLFTQSSVLSISLRSIISIYNLYLPNLVKSSGYASYISLFKLLRSHRFQIKLIV